MRLKFENLLSTEHGHAGMTGETPAEWFLSFPFLGHSPFISSIVGYLHFPVVVDSPRTWPFTCGSSRVRRPYKVGVGREGQFRQGGGYGDCACSEHPLTITLIGFLRVAIGMGDVS